MLWENAHALVGKGVDQVQHAEAKKTGSENFEIWIIEESPCAPGDEKDPQAHKDAEKFCKSVKQEEVLLADPDQACDQADYEKNGRSLLC